MARRVFKCIVGALDCQKDGTGVQMKVGEPRRRLLVGNGSTRRPQILR